MAGAPLLISLPIEVRESIYKTIFRPPILTLHNKCFKPQRDVIGGQPRSAQILRVSRQIYDEALRFLYVDTFCRISKEARLDSIPCLIGSFNLAKFTRLVVESGCIRNDTKNLQSHIGLSPARFARELPLLRSLKFEVTVLGGFGEDHVYTCMRTLATDILHVHPILAHEKESTKTKGKVSFLLEA